MDFPARLERVRVAAGISKNALAKAIGISQPFISELESGRKSPSLQTIERICEYLGLTLAEFFADDPAPTMPADVRRITDMALRIKPRQRKLLIDVIQEWTGDMDKDEPKEIHTKVSTKAFEASTDYLLERTDLSDLRPQKPRSTLLALDSWKSAKDFPDAYSVIIQIQAARRLPFEWVKQTIDEALDYFHFELPKEGSQAAHTSGAASEGGSGISLGPGQVRKR